MAVCYLVVSTTYMIGLVAEDSLSCSAISATKTQLVTQGIDNFACTAIAVAHFFFTTAGIIWWLILCFSWFLVTTLKWGEAPVGQVFSIGDEQHRWDVFTGVCSVGNLRPDALFNFVVLPQSILIAIGLVLFVCGFISIMRIRSYIKGQRLNKLEATEAASEKISKLMLRISSFSMLYIVPMIVGQVCTYYQALNMENWLTTWYSTRCLHAQRGAFGFTLSREFCPIDDGTMVHETPEAVIFFIKYLCYFTVGVACALWTINGKTLNSYGEFYARIFYGRSRVPTRQLDFTSVSGHEVVWYVTGDVKFLSGSTLMQFHQGRTWYSIEQSFLNALILQSNGQKVKDIVEIFERSNDAIRYNFAAGQFLSCDARAGSVVS
uniref:G-protein coupled receptors family 2 profile 2 domain-containing protein n=1 Tax=Ditylenchus dipsaci TaxID=166011 RepID=A0A915D9U2_9BILA